MDPGLTPRRRSLLLWWLNEVASDLGKEAALTILANPDEEFDRQVMRAAIVVGSNPDPANREAVAAFVRQNLDDESTAIGSGANETAALYALNHFRGIEDVDQAVVLELLAVVASRDLVVGEGLDRLLQIMPWSHVHGLVGRLSTEGHAIWIARELMPAFIRTRPSEAARSAGDSWWPSTCLQALAGANWREADEDLFAEVLEQIHKTSDDDARLLVRERVATACVTATSESRNHLPRRGIHVFLKLTLQGEIPTDDPQLLAALQSVDRDTLMAEMLDVGWKSNDRARRLGEVVAQIDVSLLPTLVSSVIDQNPSSAAVLIDGVTYEPLEPIMTELLDAIGDSEEVLGPVCQGSEAAATATLERWRTEGSLPAFRALEGSDHEEVRLESAPAFVRSYVEHSREDRSEVLQALGMSEDRAILLLQVLADRTEPKAARRPSAADLVETLDLLRQHVEVGQESSDLFETVAITCRESTQPTVRRAAYKVLGASSPSGGIIDLLLERRVGEASSEKSAVEEAIRGVADTLDKEVADEANPTRAAAAKELARIDPSRAAVHARNLLSAENADHRRLAANILGEAGTDPDADLMASVVDSEPHPDVRREMERAIRRLRIGDIAEAHERLGELVAHDDLDAWAVVEPDRLYGGWQEALVLALDRVARAETDHHFGTAIDQLDEVAKGLLLRAIEVAGKSVDISAANQAKAATNDLDYGAVLHWQHMNERWEWVSYFASLHGLRTEHIAERGSLTPPAEPTEEDLRTAYSFFKLGAGPCLRAILSADTASA